MCGHPGVDAIPALQASQSEGRRARSGASSTPRSSTVGVVARAQSALPGLSRAGANSSSSFAPRATGTATSLAGCISLEQGRSSRRHHAAQDAREQRHKEDKLNLEAATESSMGQAEENLSYSGKNRQPCGAARRSSVRRWRASIGARCETGAAYAWPGCASRRPMTASTQKAQSGSAAMRGGEEVEDGADDCQCTKKLSNAAQPCGAARRSRMAPMTASTQKTQSGSAAMRGGAWPGCASRRR